MGYNTCLNVANDALHEIENDPEFGRNVANAVRSQISSSKPLDIAASSSAGGIFANAAAVVGQAHADEPVLYFFQMNEGKRIGKDAPAAAIMQMRLILEANGWSVTKRKEKSQNGK
jgi:hypothetical protein